MTTILKTDFGQHAVLFLLTLGLVFGGLMIGADKEILVPLAQGLGVALPAILGAHGVACGVKAWKDGEDK